MFSVFLIVRFYVFFNDTATTEIYTYSHTLSLPDALPISLFINWVYEPDHMRSMWSAYGDDSLVELGRAFGGDHRGRRWRWRWLLDLGHDDWLGSCRRSEEHTSELQSLMRISYAVFCLKKKRQKLNTIQKQK